MLELLETPGEQPTISTTMRKELAHNIEAAKNMECSVSDETSKIFKEVLWVYLQYAYEKNRKLMKRSKIDPLEAVRRRRLGDRQTTSCIQGLSRLLFELKPNYIYF